MHSARNAMRHGIGRPTEERSQQNEHCNQAALESGTSHPGRVSPEAADGNCSLHRRRPSGTLEFTPDRPPHKQASSVTRVSLIRRGDRFRCTQEFREALSDHLTVRENQAMVSIQAQESNILTECKRLNIGKWRRLVM